MNWLAGLLLLPFCASSTRTLAWLLTDALPSSLAGWPQGGAWLAGGFLLWLLVFFVLPRPVRGYVLAHELTHALWALLMGGRVSGLRVGDRGGQVRVTKANFLVVLSPYFFPLYTVLVLVLHAGLSRIWNVRPYEPFWLALVGLTWSFHLTFTIDSLRKHQPDIQQFGRLFSCSLIYLLNVLGICVWIIAVSPMTFSALLERVGEDITWTAGFLIEAAHWVKGQIAMLWPRQT